MWLSDLFRRGKQAFTRHSLRASDSIPPQTNEQPPCEDLRATSQQPPLGSSGNPLSEMGQYFPETFRAFQLICGLRPDLSISIVEFRYPSGASYGREFSLSLPGHETQEQRDTLTALKCPVYEPIRVHIIPGQNRINYAGTYKGGGDDSDAAMGVLTFAQNIGYIIASEAFVDTVTGQYCYEFSKGPIRGLTELNGPRTPHATPRGP